eukprot:12010287-Prorocentrum_lima.AAC.1
MKRQWNITDNSDLITANEFQQEHNMTTKHWVSQMEQHVGGDDLVSASGSGFNSELVEMPEQSPQP